MDRHLTVSGFVVHEGRVALHWHRKIGAWLPAGGHIEPGEDPVEATLREVREEFAVEAEVIALAPRVDYAGGPGQLPPPFTILVCHPEPDHEHIDMVYFLRLVSGYPGRSHDPDNAIVWFDTAMLEAGEAFVASRSVAAVLPPDVQALGIEAIRCAQSARPELCPEPDEGAVEGRPAPQPLKA
jgi:8-oxo-dGTP pyrophosphatase MutT (NUDIX family)